MINVTSQNVIARKKMQPENYNEKVFCRLCLNVTSYADCEAIEKFTKEALKVVLPSLILEEGHKHLMCNSCSSNLFAAFNFKSTCMGTENIISSYINSSKMPLVDLKEVYLKENGNIQLEDISENQRICRLCIQCVTNGFVSLNEVDNDIIDRIIPQVNVNATKDPIICGPCFNSLNTHGNFVKNCLEAQEKYKNINRPAFVKMEDIDEDSEEYQNSDTCSSLNLDEGKIGNKTKLFSEDMSKTKNGWEAQEKYENADKQAYIKSEEIEIYLEDGYDVQRVYQNVDKPSIEFEELEIKLEDSCDVQETYKSIDDHTYIKSEEIEIKSEEGDQDNEPISSNLDEETIGNRNAQETKDEYVLKYETEVQIDECGTLLDVSSHKNRYKSESENGLKHKRVPKLKYKCDQCDYKSNKKSELKCHQLTHRDPSVPVMYKCDICTFESKYKRSLKSHELLHKDPSEIQMYQCDSCSYETKYKRHLKEHHLTHKHPSEIEMYKCDTCSYETKYRRYLKTHQLTHKDRSEIKMYKCDICNYKSKVERCVKDHQLLHKDPSEIRTYKCDTCAYKTLSKNRLKSHQLIHKDPSQIPMYKCDLCDYETKRKGDLKNHKLSHKDVTEIQMYECDECDYRNRRKGELTLHQLTHKDPSEIQMYICETCGYQATRMSYLNMHQLTHKNPSEIQMYRCNSCNYETKRKRRLKLHQLFHKKVKD